MRRQIFRLLSVTVMVFLVAFSVKAGDGLNVAPFLNEDYASRPNVTMVSISGSQKKWPGLSNYKSFSVTDDNALSDKLAAAVTKDGVKAISKETSYKEGKLYFGFYFLGGEGKHRRYLFFLDSRPKGIDKTTLIYIQGDWDSEQVKKKIAKKK